MKKMRFVMTLFAFVFGIAGAFAWKAHESSVVMKDGRISPSQCAIGELQAYPEGCGTTNQGKGRCQVSIGGTLRDAFNSENQSCQQPLYVQ